MGRRNRQAANDDPRRPQGPAAGVGGFWTPQRVCLLTVCGLLVVAVALVFAQTAGFEFVNLDDTDYVTGNRHVSEGLSWDGVYWALTKTQMSNWHPLTWLSLMLDCSLYHLDPAGHHVTNVLLHAAAVVGLFLVLRAMTGRLWPSALVAALFAIHPLRAESVAWVTERKDVLSGLFFVLTLAAYLSYVRYLRAGKGDSPTFLAGASLRYAGVMAFLALGLLSKAILVTVPLVLLLLDYWPLGRLSSREGSGDEGGMGDGPRLPERPSECVAPMGTVPFSAPLPSPVRALLLLLEKLPLLAVVALAIILTMWAQQSAIGAGAKYDLAWRLKSVPVAYVTYLAKLFWPVGLAGLYPRPADFPPWQYIGALAILAAITAAVAAGWRRFPYLLVGWLWFLGMSVPVIGFIQLGVVAVADRNTYLPQIGLAIALAWSAAAACGGGIWGERSKGCEEGQRPRPIRPAPFLLRPLPAAALSAAAVLAMLLVVAWRQTWFWHDSEALWVRTLACTSDNAVAHTNLAAHFGSRGRSAEAVAQYLKALALDRHNPQTLTNLGGAYLALKEFDKSETFYREALAQSPQDALINSNLGFLLTQRKRYDEAFRHYHQALASDPECAPAHYNMGLALYETATAPGAMSPSERMQRIDEAIAQYQWAISLHAENPDKVHNNLGNALKARGRVDEAMEQFQKSIRLAPNNAAAHFNLALALSDQGRTDDAEGQYRQAIGCNPNFVEAHWQLGRLLAAERRWEAAFTHYERALAIAPAFIAARLDLATAQYACGQVRAAIGQWSAVLRFQPECAPAALALASVLATCPDRRFRDGPAAMALARRADKLAGGKSPEALRVLAAAEALTGQFPQAAATAQAAIALAEAQQKEPLVQFLKTDVQRYQAGQQAQP